MKNPNGMGTCYKLTGKRRKPWVARVTVGWEQKYDEKGNPIGKMKQKCKTIGYFKTRKEGIKALANYTHDEFYEDSITIPTFGELFDEVIEQLEKDGLADKTIQLYKCSKKHLKPLFPKGINKIKLNDIQVVVDEIRDSGASFSTLNSLKSMCSHIFKHAVRKEYVSSNLSSNLIIKSKQEKKVKSPFTPEEIELVYQNVKYDKYAKIILLMIFTGMRIGEVLDMKKEDVHLDERYMVGGSKTEAGKRRIIPIHRFIEGYLRDFMDESKSQYLINDKHNQKLAYHNFMKYHYYPFMEILGISHTPHECRHTFISMTANNQFNNVMIKRIVGHKTNDITIDIYTHFRINELIDEIDKLKVPFEL